MISVYIKFVLQLHFLTCIWIYLGKLEHFNSFSFLNINTDGGWINRNEEISGEMNHLEIYVHAMSLITETISKVGYGMSYAPLETIEMIFLTIVIMQNSNLLVMIFY